MSYSAKDDPKFKAIRAKGWSVSKVDRTFECGVLCIKGNLMKDGKEVAKMEDVGSLASIEWKSKPAKKEFIADCKALELGDLHLKTPMLLSVMGTVLMQGS